MVQPASRPEARRRLGSQTASELGAPIASSIPEQLPGREPASARKGCEDALGLRNQRRRRIVWTSSCCPRSNALR